MKWSGAEVDDDDDDDVVDRSTRGDARCHGGSGGRWLEMAGNR